MTPPAAQAVAEYNMATCIGFVSDSKALVEAKAEGTSGSFVTILVWISLIPRSVQRWTQLLRMVWVLRE
jgi:hypothetical protein